VGNADVNAFRERAAQRASGLLEIAFPGFWHMTKSDQETGSAKGVPQRNGDGVPVTFSMITH
jgi:hypothetical protein